MRTAVVSLSDLAHLRRHYNHAVSAALEGNERLANDHLDDADALLDRYLEPMYQQRDALARLEQQREHQRTAWRIRKARQRQELKLLSSHPAVA